MDIRVNLRICSFGIPEDAMTVSRYIDLALKSNRLKQAIFLGFAASGSLVNTFTYVGQAVIEAPLTASNKEPAKEIFQKYCLQAIRSAAFFAVGFFLAFSSIAFPVWSSSLITVVPHWTDMHEQNKY